MDWIGLNCPHTELPKVFIDATWSPALLAKGKPSATTPTTTITPVKGRGKVATQTQMQTLTQSPKNSVASPAQTQTGKTVPVASDSEVKRY